LIEEFGAGRVAIKECIDFAVHSSNNPNKAIRDAAMAMFAAIYKQLGEKTVKFLDGVKPATMQLITAEFDKVTPYAKGEF
jgi:cytoskeleton-associated protein 5